MREELIQILANIGDDYAGTVNKLEKYIYEKGTTCYWDGTFGRDVPEWLIEYKKQTTNK